MKDIPVHQLTDRTSFGVELKHFSQGDMPKDVETLSAHRDDHYLFFLLVKGSASLMIDFHELIIHPSSFYYILPGQVHHRIRNEVAEGWFVAVDTLLVLPQYRNIFENQLLLQQPYQINNKQLNQSLALLSLLDEQYQDGDQHPFSIPVIHSLLQSYIGTVAGCYSAGQNIALKPSRPVLLSQDFKKQLSQNIRTIKSPSAYAAMLNVTESYLNEVLKKTTGFSVSYWIVQEIMLEAKRLLYYSQLNVKQIAHSLGYQDHAYFSRLFSKSAGITPLGFREQYHK